MLSAAANKTQNYQGFLFTCLKLKTVNFGDWNQRESVTSELLIIYLSITGSAVTERISWRAEKAGVLECAHMVPVRRALKI